MDEFGIVMKKQVCALMLIFQVVEVTLDLKAEAHSMDQFQRNFKFHNFVKIPQPLYYLVTQTVLVET